MPRTPSVLHMLCGRIASGKSTIAARLGEAPDTVVLSEDYLLAQLYPDEINALDDYVRCHRRLRAAIAPHITDLLRTGISVVLDFQANTPQARNWMRGLFEASGADHQLHLLTTTEQACKHRLRQRNASGTHQYQVTEAQFDEINRHFAAPTEQEGFTIIRHD